MLFIVSGVGGTYWSLDEVVTGDVWVGLWVGWEDFGFVGGGVHRWEMYPLINSLQVLGLFQRNLVEPLSYCGVPFAEGESQFIRS